ncbi:MAG: cytochrome b/b6 domain-containing protein [Gammaproteobacteria bacterium]|nr:MAG: cytochrome b/b6 domain-containing protein [Gammaproteobacteria bacterium]
MAGSTKKSKYRVAQVLHWLGVIVIGFNLLSGWRLDGFELEIRKVLLAIHSGVGTFIFFLMLFRWWWRREHRLYTPPRWWKRPSFVVQWVFYPLVLTQVVIGLGVAAFIGYEVLGFGIIPYSSLAADNEAIYGRFLQMHDLMAWLLITLVAVHGFERWRTIFIDDVAEVVPVKAQEPLGS